MQKGFSQVEGHNSIMILIDFLGVLEYNASIPNKRDARNLCGNTVHFQKKER